MLFLLSPAKSLDYDTPAGDVPHTLPAFVPQAAELIEVLRPYSPQQIAEVITGTLPVTPEVAEKLGKLAGTTAPFWLKLQAEQ